MCMALHSPSNTRAIRHVTVQVAICMTVQHIHDITYPGISRHCACTVVPGSCDLRLPIKPAKYGLKLKVVLK